MALTLGAHHVVTGAGQFAIAQPVGLAISVTGIPAYVARDPGVPTLYHRMAHINLGHALGWQPAIDLELVPQLVYPLPPEFTLLRHTLLTGETATIDELVAAPVLNSVLQPWDRNPAPAVKGGVSTLAGVSGGTTQWTYTVPAGKLFALTHADISIERTVVATTAGLVILDVEVAGVVLLQIEVTSNLALAYKEVGFDGQVIVPAGQTVLAWAQSTAVGGSCRLTSHASGFLFDV